MFLFVDFVRARLFVPSVRAFVDCCMFGPLRTSGSCDGTGESAPIEALMLFSRGRMFLFASCFALSMTICAHAAECPAGSAGELRQKFEAAFKSKDQAAFFSLFTWRGIDAEGERLFKSDLSSLLSKEFMRSELRDASLSTKDAKRMEEVGIRLNVIPVATLYFERSFGPVANQIEKTSGQLAIGKVGNCFVLGAYSKQRPPGKS